MAEQHGQVVVRGHHVIVQHITSILKARLSEGPWKACVRLRNSLLLQACMDSS